MERVFNTLARLQAHIYRGVPTLVAGALGTLSISYPVCWFLAPISLAIFFTTLWSAPTLKSALWRTFVFALITAGAGVWWFWDTLPLDWVGVANPWYGGYFVLASWGPVAIVLALGVLVPMAGLWLLRNHPLRILAAAPLWALGEELRMWNFSILTYAPRSLWGPHFSPASLGYSLTENTYVLKLASFGGLHMLEGVVALIGASLAALYITRNDMRRMILPVSVLCIVLVAPLTVPAPTRPHAPLSAVIVSSMVPVGTTGDVGSKYIPTLTEASTRFPNASLILLPEEQRFEKQYTTDAERGTAFSSIFGTREIRIVESRHEPIPGGAHTSLAYVDQNGTTLGLYKKLFLMPAGEYMPYFLTAAFSLRPDHGVGGFTKRLPQVRDADTGVIVNQFKGHTLGGLVCSDSLSPILYHDLGVRGANILLNSANPSWFHSSRLLYDKSVQMGKLHAAQNHAYYLQSSNGSPAFAIDPTGRVIAETPWGESSMTEVELYTEATP